MAKVYSGRDAQLLVGSDVQLKVTSWSMTATMNVLDITSLNDSIRSYSPGITSYSGNASLLYYKDGSRNDAGVLLRKLIKTGTDGASTADLVTFKLRLIDGTDINDVELQAYITSASFGATVGDVVGVNIDFQATGALPTVSF